MSSRTSSSLKELKNLREAVLAEEKAKTQALLQNLPPNSARLPPEPADLTPISDESLASESDPDLDKLDSPEPAIDAPEPANLEDLPVSDSSELEPSLPPNVLPVPTPKPPQPDPRPASINRNKAPAKDAALIIPLTPKTQERLQRHVENSRWSPAELVMELVRASLHQGYPAIQFGDKLIARGGTYRTFERNPFEGVLKIISGQGVFTVTARPEHPDYQHWLSYFTEQNNPNTEAAASQACLYSLQNYLESYDDYRLLDWTKQISPQEYFVSDAG